MAKSGQPTKYKKAYCEQASKLCALGATDESLADFFNVCEKTINNWKEAHPEFLQSIKGSKLARDEAVERSLFDRAMGYSHPEDKIFNQAGEPLIVPTTKHYAPDTAAAIYWLNNRQPDRWKNVKQVDHTNKGDAFKSSPENYTKEQLIAIINEEE